MYYLDTETCGLHGPIVLMQYALDDGEIKLHPVWDRPIQETMELIESFMEEGIIGFNLAFDHFHLCQLYTCLNAILENGHKFETTSEHHFASTREHLRSKPPRIEDYLCVEENARLGPCLNPATAHDVFLHARKGPYQSLMKRHPIKIKRVPTPMAQLLADELAQRIQLKDVFFAAMQNSSRRWVVKETPDPAFSHIELKFAPKSGLKTLAMDALGIKDVAYYNDISIHKDSLPDELGFAPYAEAVLRASRLNKSLNKSASRCKVKTWPYVIPAHISFWNNNPLAREYAINDVVYTRELYKFFGSPPMGDVDSILACMAGAVRWKGFAIDTEKLKALKEKNRTILAGAKVAHSMPDRCRKYISERLSASEASVIKTSTGAKVLEEIAKWHISQVCPHCKGMGISGAARGTTRGTSRVGTTHGTTHGASRLIDDGLSLINDGCPHCKDGLVISMDPHPAAERAQEILDLRKAAKRIQLIDKFLVAGRFHASMNIIGTLSGRQSGADQLNAQGINREKDGIRSCITFTDEPGYSLCGGDFDAFEVSIADAVYKDPKMHDMLEKGESVHALFGEMLFPGLTASQIKATKGLSGDKDKYLRSKNGVFAMLYGGQAFTLETRVGVDPESAESAYKQWCAAFPIWTKERQKYFDMFCSMHQPRGIGSRVVWKEPRDNIESLLGFRRYFTLENTICKALYDLANAPPKAWASIGNFKVHRRASGEEQQAHGAVRSALYAAAFALQGANMRAAANHVIQSTGAGITKEMQHMLWSLQPIGCKPWVVQPLNIHDEIMCPVRNDHIDVSRNIVNNYVQSRINLIPMLKMIWKTGLKTWEDK